MLNISKISKMLLLLGLVLAFSCLTLDANLAFAEDTPECTNAKKDLADMKKNSHPGKKAIKDAEDKVKKANNALQKASKDCEVKFEYCTGYQTAKAELDGAEKELSNAQSAYADILSHKEKEVVDICNIKHTDSTRTKDKNVGAEEDSVVNAKLEMEEACKKDPSSEECFRAKDAYDVAKSDLDIAKETEANNAAEDGNKAGKNQKKSEKSQEKVEEKNQKAEETEEARKDAEKKLKEEQEKVKNQETVVEIRKADMKAACTSNPDSQECKDAQAEYAKEVKTLEEYAAAEEDAIKKAEKEYNKASKQDRKADKKADKAEQKDRDRAEKAVANAQKDVDKFCTLGHSSYNKEKCEKAKNDLTAAENDETYRSMHPDEELAKKEQEARDKKAKEDEIASIKDGDAKDAMDNYMSEGDLALKGREVADAEKNAENAQKEADALKTARDAVCAENPKGKKCREADEAYRTAQAKADDASEKAKAAQDEYDHYKNKSDAAKEAFNRECGADGSKKDSRECQELELKRQQKEIDGMDKAIADLNKQISQDKAAVEAAQAEYDKAVEEEALACAGGQDTDACIAAKEKTRMLKLKLDAAKEQLANHEAELPNLEFQKQQLIDGADGLQQQMADADAAAAAAAARAAEEEAKEKRRQEADQICAKYGEEDILCKNARARIDKPDHRGVMVSYKYKNTEIETGFNYTETDQGDVFEMVTRRAAYIIVSIKPIVYIFAGFGLIAFAWGAIFNKISWKHFANISIGLFLVANAGRLIEYMVTSGDGDNYYIGQWDSNRDKDKKHELSTAFGDTYHIYSYELDEIPERYINNNVPAQITNNVETEGAKEEKAPSDDPVQAATESFTDKDKFCQSGLGFGKGGFKNCVKDVVGAVKHVADAVKTTVNVVNNVKGRVEDIKDAKEGLNEAFKQVKDGDVFAGLHGILNNLGEIDGAISTSGGAIVSGYKSVSDNLTNIGDSSNIYSRSTLDILGDGLSSVEGATNAVNNATNKGDGDN